MENPAFPILRYDFKNTEPVELLDLTQSLVALGDEYKRFLGSNPGYGAPTELKLYVRDIRAGSVIADLIAFAPFMLVFMEHANSVVAFGQYLHAAYRFLTSKTKDKPLAVDKRNYENLSQIVEPVAKDGGSQLNISTINNQENNVYLTININSMEANMAQNIARREIASMREPATRFREQAVMYWYQARDDFGPAGDLGIIESITTKPVKVTFLSNDIKQQMIYPAVLFRKAHVVDVEVESVQGQPVLYKIVKYHGLLDKFIGKDSGEDENMLIRRLREPVEPPALGYTRPTRASPALR